MHHRVTMCRVDPNYLLWLEFEDGVKGHVYLGNMLDIGAFRSWKDVREFEKAEVDESGIVTWKSDIRIDPDVLYWGVLEAPARG